MASDEVLKSPDVPRCRRPELMMLITESSPWLLKKIADQTLQIERGEIPSKPATE